MNKIFAFILLVLLVNLFEVNAANCDDNAIKKEDNYEECYYLKLSGDKTHCCAVEVAEEVYRCEGLTDDQYENIKRYKDYRRHNKVDDNDKYDIYDDLGIECSSRFLSISLLVLIAFLL